MTEKVIYWEEVDSCEHCPGSIPENMAAVGMRTGNMHVKGGLYRCKHDTTVTFQQNRDMGVPANCPKRQLPIVRH
jgi:glycerol-3-phosphate responsive antiterminator